MVAALRAIGVRIQATTTASRSRGVPTRPKGGNDRRARRPPDRDARGGRRARLRATAWSSRGPSRSRYQLPRLLRPPRPCERCDDRRHRRPGRGRQEHRRAPARRAARLSLPRHGRDVPRRSPGWRCETRPTSATATRSAGSPGRTRSASTTRVACSSPGRRHRRDPTARIDRVGPDVARHQEVREVMRERQRELADEGDVVIEGRDIGTRRRRPTPR